MSKLVIVESPNKIKSIEKYLGGDYKVLASVGHIVKLPSSGSERLGIDMETWKPLYKIDETKAAVVKELMSYSKKAERVLIATDPDREGEAIADNLVEFLKLGDNYDRIRFNEITKDAVSAAVNSPSKVDKELVNAQIARRLLDRIIGYKLSGLMRKKVYNTPTSPSAGRVQSIALKLVVEREKEIDAFVPVKYFLADAVVAEDVIAKLYFPNNTENKNWIDPNDVEGIKKMMQGSMKVQSINISKRNDARITPLKQSALYKKADSTLSLSSRQVQSAAQRLYEGYGDGGLISYPRTDSTRLSISFIEPAKKYIEMKYGAEYVATEIKGVGGAQDAHEAIRPTSLGLTPEAARAKFNLNNNEYKVYKLIWTHTMQSIMKVPIREVIRYELEENGLNFRMSSSRIVFDGYYKATGRPKMTELPIFKEGEVVKVQKYNVEEHETKPPARFNDGSLIETLDRIKVGRPSTFATTVNILKNREYVEMEGRAMKPTAFGKLINEKLSEGFPNIITEEYTAQLETQLDQIADGKHDYKKTLDEFWEKFTNELASATQTIEISRMEHVSAGKECPKCGSELIVRRNKRDGSRFFGCSNFPECKHIESDPSYKPRRRFFKKK